MGPHSDLPAIDLARELRRAGLVWRPARFDYFHIPDRHLDEHVFVIADLSTEVQVLADGISVIAFNGAVEWSLDYILTQDTIWLPTESQLRTRLGDAFLHLRRDRGGYAVSVVTSTGPVTVTAPRATDAYARALLAVMRGKS